ncbi:MAG: DUF4304 domain-containing protein [Clostridia bacterium]|nr:DUF4304 domain-containing protein [Clostridia bacterium]
MFNFFKKAQDIDVTQTVDEIEAAVYAYIKPLGFRKYGRTLHRFVSEDISQVIHFQSGMPTQGMGGMLCVNIGIRVPECDERSFQPQTGKKKYYREYQCNIRSRLGTVSGKRETWFDLRAGAEKISKSIITEIEEIVIPVFDILNSRDAILAHRREYPLFDSLNCRLILLEECMIFGHLGNTEKAKELFEIYYRSAVDKYNDLMKNGRKEYLKKGERVVYMGQDITAEKDGYVTLYGASHGHIDYLDELAVQLGIR